MRKANLKNHLYDKKDEYLTIEYYYSFRPESSSRIVEYTISYR